jgi:hypothetical protein
MKSEKKLHKEKLYKEKLYKEKLHNKSCIKKSGNKLFAASGCQHSIC